RPTASQNATGFDRVIVFDSNWSAMVRVWGAKGGVPFGTVTLKHSKWSRQAGLGVSSGKGGQVPPPHVSSGAGSPASVQGEPSASGVEVQVPVAGLQAPALHSSLGQVIGGCGVQVPAPSQTSGVQAEPSRSHAVSAGRGDRPQAPVAGLQTPALQASPG